MSYKYSTSISRSFLFLWLADPCKLDFQLLSSFRTKIESFVRFKKIKILQRLDQDAELLHIITSIFLLVSFSFVFHSKRLNFQVARSFPTIKN